MEEQAEYEVTGSGAVEAPGADGTPEVESGVEAAAGAEGEGRSLRDTTGVVEIGSDGDAGTRVQEEAGSEEERVHGEEARQEDVAGSSEVASLRSEIEGMRAEIAGFRSQAVEGYRRALLAENAGKVVPELVTGSSLEELEASVERARAAFESVRTATLAEMAAAAVVGAGNGQRGSAVDVEQLSPMQKIAYGLRPVRD